MTTENTLPAIPAWEKFGDFSDIICKQLATEVASFIVVTKK